MGKAKMFLIVVVASIASVAFCQGKLFTIVHTNDMHSRLQGFAPETDYTPSSTGDDATVGGWSRIATAIASLRASRTNPVLVVDAGDFLMGTLFHMVCRENAAELHLMKAMGYDAVGLGNHEFDLMPDGLARIISSASAAPGMPTVLCANAVFGPEGGADDSLKRVFSQGLVKPYTVIVEDGVRIGIFAVLGEDAAEVAPFASPVSFRTPAEAASEMVNLLRQKEKADIVVCLSHSGLWRDPAKSEDEQLARRVPGIDIIVSGHTHSKIDKPIVVGNTIIAQAWEYGKQVGVLDFSWDGGKVALRDWKAVDINDSIRGDPVIQAQIERTKRAIDAEVLSPYGLHYDQVLAETDADMLLPEAESGLGNMIADSIRSWVDSHDSDPKDPQSRVAIALESNGVIRDQIMKGRTGRIAVADLFRALPLGIGCDDTMAYPLITVYLTGSEIKKAMEIIASIYPMKGSDYWLQVSGVKFTYNPHGILFDKVTGIWLGDETVGYAPLDYSARNTKLYRVAANYYNATFLKIIGEYTYGFLTIVPKDRDGKPIDDLAAVRVDADKSRAGIQELKEWTGLMDYVHSFADANGNDIPDIPAFYKAPAGRELSKPSWNPISLLSHGTLITWAAFAILILLLALVAGLICLIVKLSKRRRA